MFCEADSGYNGSLRRDIVSQSVRVHDQTMGSNTRHNTDSLSTGDNNSIYLTGLVEGERETSFKCLHSACIL